MMMLYGRRYKETICANSKTGGNLALSLPNKCNGEIATKRCTMHYNTTDFTVINLCAPCTLELFYDSSRYHIQMREESVFRSQLTDDQIKSLAHSAFFWKGTRKSYSERLCGFVINSHTFGCLVEVEDEQIVRFKDGLILCAHPTRAQLRSLVDDLLHN